MKKTGKYALLIVFFLEIGCQSEVKRFHNPAEVENAFENGRLTLATAWADSLIKGGQCDSSTFLELRTIVDNSGRLKADFTMTAPETDTLLKKEIGEFTPAEREFWERNNWLEYKMIDGEKHYFKRAVSNLILILKSKYPARKGEQILDSQSLFCLKHSRKVIIASGSFGKPVIPVKLKINYQLTVKADAVPDGEIVRCWLPWPHENHSRQTNVKLLKMVPESYWIAPDSVEQRSVYCEQKALKGKPVVFNLQFEYVSMAQYFDLNKIKTQPADTSKVIYKRYTAEQYPQIEFTGEIKRLSDSIVGGTSNSAVKVRKIYYWINDHIIWTGALEYSIIPFIPGYVLANKRGDCGMQTMLFMAMARYQHIPVKWQSGWMMHPHEVNLHDWCEVFYDGIGWVPLDMSFNLQKSDNLRDKEFYIGGIDAYRLIINDGIGSRLVPEKKFPRSEPFDFQRGEVEWREGNLYFDQWDYHINVEYL